MPLLCSSLTPASYQCRSMRSVYLHYYILMLHDCSIVIAVARKVSIELTPNSAGSHGYIGSRLELGLHAIALAPHRTHTKRCAGHAEGGAGRPGGTAATDNFGFRVCLPSC